MATIVYKNAKIFLGDVELSSSLSQLDVDFAAESLDITTFGNDTRIKRGGLFTAKISGKGYFDLGSTLGLDNAVFGDMGTDDTVITVFTDGISEGVEASGAAGLGGFAMKGVVLDMKIGGGVGTVLPIDFSCESRGLI